MKKYDLQRFNIDKASLKRKLTKVEDPELLKLGDLLKQRTKEYSLDDINEFCKILIQTKKDADSKLVLRIREEVSVCREEDNVEKLKIEIIKIVNDKDSVNNIPEIVSRLSKEYELSEMRVTNYLTLEQEKRLKQYLSDEGVSI